MLAFFCLTTAAACGIIKVGIIGPVSALSARVSAREPHMQISLGQKWARICTLFFPKIEAPTLFCRSLPWNCKELQAQSSYKNENFFGLRKNLDKFIKICYNNKGGHF